MCWTRISAAPTEIPRSSVLPWWVILILVVSRHHPQAATETAEHPTRTPLKPLVWAQRCHRTAVPRSDGRRRLQNLCRRRHAVVQSAAFVHTQQANCRGALGSSGIAGAWSSAPSLRKLMLKKPVTPASARPSCLLTSNPSSHGISPARIPQKHCTVAVLERATITTCALGSDNSLIHLSTGYSSQGARGAARIHKFLSYVM